jgi:PadR family transcriptional regulator PadR
MAQKSGLMQGTLDMLVLRTLSRGDAHGWGITQKLEQLSQNALRVEEGSLYPALYRMEAKGWIKGGWRPSDKGPRAKYYTLTSRGRKQLETETESWERMTGIIAQVMRTS